MKTKVKFKIQYGFPENFIDYLLKQGYELTDIQPTEMGYTACCRAKFYKEISHASRNFQCKTKVIARQGIYFKIRKYLQRKGLTAGVAIFLVACVVFPNLIWRIDINAVNEDKRNSVGTELFYNGVYPGTFYNKEKMKDLKNRMMREHEDISYIAFNFYRGSLECIIYPVSEREDYRKTESENNIYSRLSGVVTDLRVYSGFSKVSIGQSVSRGELLVSNENTDKYDHYSTSDTSAYIEGICKKQYEIYVPYKSDTDIFTGEYHVAEKLYFMGKEFVITDFKADENRIYSKRSTIVQPDILGFKIPAVIKKDMYYNIENSAWETSVLDTYSKAKSRIISIIENDEKLKKEINREYSYNFGDDGVTFSCTVEGHYVMT